MTNIIIEGVKMKQNEVKNNGLKEYNEKVQFFNLVNGLRWYK